MTPLVKRATAQVNERTAAVFYVADRQSRPPLRAVVETAHAAGVPVLVDAAAQLPPVRNLRRFIEEGADLVAFSGGKAIGGPQGSGILCGKRDLIMSAALQQLDLDIFWEQWQPPANLIDKARLKGVPQHGIGRQCKVGKETIVGLLTALRIFIAEGDAARHKRWLALMTELAEGLRGINGVKIELTGAANTEEVPHTVLTLNGAAGIAALDLIIRLQSGSPAIQADPTDVNSGIVAFNPICMKPGEPALVAKAVNALLQ
jgi:L-seryl-tRNA(Ser) seleniumtransferase